MVINAAGKNIKAGEGVERRRQAGVKMFSQMFRGGPLSKPYLNSSQGVQATWPPEETAVPGLRGALSRRSEGKWGCSRLGERQAGSRPCRALWGLWFSFWDGAFGRLEEEERNHLVTCSGFYVTHQLRLLGGTYPALRRREGRGEAGRPAFRQEVTVFWTWGSGRGDGSGEVGKKRSDPGYISKPARFSGRLDLNIQIKKKKQKSKGWQKADTWITGKM